METFTLVISVWLGWWNLYEAKRPGLTEIECKLQAAEVYKPLYAKCVAMAERPPAPPPNAKSMVVCPFSPPCWRDGEPIVGAL